MKTSHDYIKRAIQLAADNVDAGGWPFSAVIVKDGQVLSEAVNSVHLSHDPSDHAEIAAIRIATSALASSDLSGCTMYIIGPPCPMCNTCMVLSGIDNVVCATSIEDKDAVLTKLPATNGLYSMLRDGYNVAAIEYETNDAYTEEATGVLKAWNDKQ